MTQWTEALPGASESHENVRWAKRISQPAAKMGPNKSGTCSPWVIELVVTKANRPLRVLKRSRLFMGAVAKLGQGRKAQPQDISCPCSGVLKLSRISG